MVNAIPFGGQKQPTAWSNLYHEKSPLLTSDRQQSSRRGFENAENILSQEGYSVSRKYVIGVLMDDRPGAMAAITEYLQTKDINISNAYGFILKEGARAVLILEVDDFDKAERMIRRGGFHTLSKEELQNL